MTRNLTIAIDEDTARWVRVEAAKHDRSVSRFLSELLQAQMTADDSYERARRSWHRRQPKILSSPESAYPTRDDVHAR